MTNELTYLNLHPVNFLIISGILQGFILSGILFFKRTDNLLSSRLLSLTIVAINLHLTYLMILDLNLDNRYPQLLWFPYSYLTAIGPFILLYVRSLLEKHFKISKRELLLFLPLGVELLVQIIQIIYSITKGIIYYNTPSDTFFTVVIYVVSFISIFYYLKHSLKIIHSHEKWIEKNFSNSLGITLSWLFKLLSYYRIIWLLWIPFAVIFSVFFRFQIQNLPFILTIYGLILGITYLIYWIGIESLRRIDWVFTHSESPSSNESSTYDQLSSEQIRNYVNSIEELMINDQLYLNEHLSLRNLSSQLTIDPNLVSHLLNTHLNKTFYEFINGYRVEEVKRKLEQQKYKDYTLLGIALASGFNSKTSFNRVFKQITGMTPSQYQKGLNKK